MLTRRSALLFLVLPLIACGGPNTRLVTVVPGKGAGKVEFSVKNLTDVPINTFFMAKTERIDAAGGNALDPKSPEGDAAWGPDLLGRAVVMGKSERIPVPEAGLWEALAVDRDNREQRITHLKLQAGGTYILELYENGWRVYR
ncbi:MAG TPA: hypothetical protein VF103_10510 [Polyangiaceae bacterium]